MSRKSPNVVLITIHDLGTTLGCYGADPVLRTPRLDRLAAEGVRWQSHFATAPFCSASRGAIVTGQYPHVNGLMGLCNLGWDMPPGSQTIGQILGAAGYETLLFGLQHEAKDPVARSGLQQMQAHGSRSSTVVAPLAADWLRAQQGRDRPFYAQIGFSDVHRPFPEELAIDAALEDIQPLPYLDDTPGVREDLRDFYGLIQQMDRGVGQILDALGEGNLRDDTLVVFTVDHGIPFPRAKSTLYDAGLQTALIMRWPGGFEGGKVLSHLSSNVDVLPTVLAAIGIEAPGGLQGESALPALQGQAFDGHDWVYAGMNTNAVDLRRGIRTATHKYIDNTGGRAVMRLPTDIEQSKTRRDMPPPPYWQLPPVEFYDLTADPCEQNNLAGSDDPAVARLEAELAARLQQVREDTNDPLLRGPIERPSDEAEIIGAIYAKLGIEM